MKKLIRMTIIIVFVSICLMKVESITLGMILFSVAYYLFTLSIVLGLRKFLKFLSSEAEEA